MSNGRSISMKEISKLAGVSVATVSRVINNNGRFSDETRERVEAVIKEYGYRPSIMAKGFRQKKVQNIGIIVPDITNEFFAKIVLSVQQRLYEYNYSALIYNTNELDALEQEYVSMLAAQNVSGIIYISGGKVKKESAQIGVPAVYVDRMPNFDTNENVVAIESDNVEGGYIATIELLEKGCVNPAILMDKRDVSPQTGRFIGYQKALWEYGFAINEKNVLKVDKVDFHNSYDTITKALSGGLLFDGLFCTTDWLAMGAIKALNDNGMNIPDDMKVIGFDDISISEFGIIPFTTIRQNIDEIGQAAADLIMSMINGENPVKQHYFFPVSIVRRKTT